MCSPGYFVPVEHPVQRVTLVADVIAINNAVSIDRCSREEDGIDLKGDH